MAYSEATRREFARWYVRDQLERSERWGLDAPSSINGWGREYDVSPRTLRRWLAQAQSEEGVEPEDPEFARMLADAEAERVAGVEQSHPGVLPEGLGGSPIEQQFGEVKHALLEKAKSGDVQAMKVWLNEFGATLVEQERQSLESDLAGMSDADLLKRTRGLLVQLEGLLAEGELETDVEGRELEDVPL